jgi:hypothetical protein
MNSSLGCATVGEEGKLHAVATKTIAALTKSGNVIHGGSQNFFFGQTTYEFCVNCPPQEWHKDHRILLRNKYVKLKVRQFLYIP